jgi:hypothetical protein
MRINIAGAGMSGLLAANILRRHDIIVYEKQNKLPNNHHAVLRFRTPKVGEVLGIPFKQVTMMKSYVPYKNPVADSLSYARKCTGLYKSDRSIFELGYGGSHIDIRYVAPPDLIDQMSKNINIKYEIDYEFYNDSNIPVISTIPMPILMKILDYKRELLFHSISGIVVTATIANCDAYVSVLFPGSEPFSRASITGNQLMVEFPNVKKFEKRFDPNDYIYNLVSIYHHLGLYDCLVADVQVKKQEYFKITEIDDAERKKFQRWATVHHNIYSLGRYATWRPKLLLDDLIDDVNKIENWIKGGSHTAKVLFNKNGEQK